MLIVGRWRGRAREEEGGELAGGEAMMVRVLVRLGGSAKMSVVILSVAAEKSGMYGNCSSVK